MQKLPVIIAPRPEYYLGLTIVVWLFFFIPGMLILFGLGAPRPDGEPPSTHIYIGLFLMITSFVCFCVMRLFRGKVARTVITEVGIEHVSVGKRFSASWDQVESVEVAIFPAPIVVVGLRTNSKAFAKRLSFSTLGTGCSPKEVKELVERMTQFT